MNMWLLIPLKRDRKRSVRDFRPVPVTSPKRICGHCLGISQTGTKQRTDFFDPTTQVYLFVGEHWHMTTSHAALVAKWCKALL